MTYATLGDIRSRLVKVMDQVSTGEEVIVLRAHTVIAKSVMTLCLLLFRPKDDLNQRVKFTSLSVLTFPLD